MSYQTPAAFRAALEARLNNAAQAGGRPVGRARKLVAFSRVLTIAVYDPNGRMLEDRRRRGEW